MKFAKTITKFGQGRLAVVIPRVLLHEAQLLEGKQVIVTITSLEDGCQPITPDGHRMHPGKGKWRLSLLNVVDYLGYLINLIKILRSLNYLI